MTVRVVALSRYPVKSLLGEPLAAVDVDARGVAGDRAWAVRTSDGKLGSGKSTRRFTAVPGLLQARARYDGERALVDFPDRAACPADDPAAESRLSDLVGVPVSLVREADVSHYDDGPVSLLGLASVAALSAARGEEVEPERFRANILLDTPAAYAEEAWVDRDVQVGTAVLHVTMCSPRCVMVNLPTADLPSQPGNLALLGDLTGGHLGVIATVVRPGRVAVGDPVTVLAADSGH